MAHKDRAKRNTYMAEYMLRRYYKRKAWAIDYLGGSCSVCGSTNDLEFDHRDPKAKSFTIGSSGWSLSEKKFKEEVEKCQLLCATCHKTKHRSTSPCGTVQRYWCGCRCEPCVVANKRYHVERRARG